MPLAQAPRRFGSFYPLWILPLSLLALCLQSCATSSPSEQSSTTGVLASEPPPGVVVLEATRTAGSNVAGVPRAVVFPVEWTNPIAVVCRVAERPGMRVGPVRPDAEVSMSGPQQMVLAWRPGEGPGCESAELQTVLMAMDSAAVGSPAGEAVASGWPVAVHESGRVWSWAPMPPTESRLTGEGSFVSGPPGFEFPDSMRRDVTPADDSGQPGSTGFGTGTTWVAAPLR